MLVSRVVLKLFIKSGGGKMLLEFLSVILKVCLPFSTRMTSV